MRRGFLVARVGLEPTMGDRRSPRSTIPRVKRPLLHQRSGVLIILARRFHSNRRNVDSICLWTFVSPDCRIRLNRERPQSSSARHRWTAKHQWHPHSHRADCTSAIHMVHTQAPRWTKCPGSKWHHQVRSLESPGYRRESQYSTFAVIDTRL